MKNTKKKINIVLALIALLVLAGCESPFKKGPNSTDVKKAWFEDKISRIKIKKWDCKFVDNPEAAKSNRYEVYCDAEYAYKEPLYRGYSLEVDPGNDVEIGQLVRWNKILKSSGKPGFSEVFKKNYEANHPLSGQIYFELKKVDGRWVHSETYLLSGSINSPGFLKKAFKGKALIYGSSEHIKELKKNGYDLPDKKNLKTAEEQYAEQFNQRIKKTVFVPNHFEII